MNERHRQHEQSRRDFWAAVYIEAISHNIYEVGVADTALNDYDAKFPQPIEGEQYLQQKAQDK
jgi:hypothetical protein